MIEGPVPVRAGLLLILRFFKPSIREVVHEHLDKDNNRTAD